MPVKTGIQVVLVFMLTKGSDLGVRRNDERKSI
jgi:hypothetical protein